MRRGIAGAIAGLILAALVPLGVAAPAAAAPYCTATGTLHADALPEQVPLDECDLVGRAVEFEGLRGVVPPPGKGLSQVALTETGELSLEIETSADGVVAIEAHAETVAAPAPAVPSRPGALGGFSAAAVPEHDSFSTAAPLAIPRSYLPTFAQTFSPNEATLETGEPAAGCDAASTGSLWYRIQREGTLRRIKLRADVPLAVYQGTSLDSLKRVTCLPAWAPDTLVTLGSTGTYYVQAGTGAEPDKVAATVHATNAEMRPDGPPPCDVKAHTLIDRSRRRKLQWRYNDAEGPSDLSFRQALRGVKRGINVITGSKNDCGMPDRVSARAEYLGKTRKRASLCVSGGDGKNVVAYGPAPFGMVGLACSTWTFNADGTRNVLESDIRLTESVVWTMRPDAPACDNQMDLVGVVAHETGHVFGLDHAQGTKGLNQTMSPSASACNGAARTLGRGDVVALRKIY